MGITYTSPLLDLTEPVRLLHAIAVHTHVIISFVWPFSPTLSCLLSRYIMLDHFSEIFEGTFDELYVPKHARYFLVGGESLRYRLPAVLL